MPKIFLLLYILWLFCLPNHHCFDANYYKKRGCDTSIRLRDLESSDYVIAGVFPCHQFVNGRYQQHFAAITWVSAMLYTLDEINKNNTILPGIKLGYDIRDSCNEIEVATKYTLGFMVDDDLYGADNRSILAGVIGGASSPISTIVSTMLSSEFIPQISYSSSSTELLSWKYRSFLRTVPSDRHQAAAIVDLIRSFGWTYISAFAVDDDYGRVGLEELQKVTKRDGICLAKARTFTERLHEIEIDDILLHMRELSAENTHVVVLWAPYNLARTIIKATKKANITNIVFIGTEIWGEFVLDDFDYRTIILELGQPTFEDSFIKVMANELTINWKNPWFRESFPMGCPLSIYNSPNRPPDCFYPVPPPAAASIITKTRKKYPQVIGAVYALAYGLHSYLQCDKVKCIQPKNGLDYKVLLEKVRNTDFIVPGSKENFRVSFDSKAYEIKDKEYLFNMFFNGTRVQFGRWLGTRNITMNESLINWGPRGKPFGRCSVNCRPGSYRLNGSSPCCWGCPSCPVNSISNRINQYRCRMCDPVFEVPNENRTYCIKLREVRITLDDYIGLMLLSSCIVGVLITLFIVLVFAKYWDTPVVKSSSREISIIQLISLALLFCLPVLYFFKLTPLFCMFRTLVFGFLFTTVIAIILVKTYRLIRVFSNRFTKVSRFLQNKYQIFFIYLLVVFQLIVVLLWNWNFQPRILRDVRKSQLLFFITCDQNQTVVFWIEMLYILILTLISGYYAFRARKLPENYNEAQYISLSMFTAIVIWIAYVPLFFSLSSDDNNIAFLFQNFVCTMSITLIMYSYKVYIILFNPKLNSPEHARQQHKDHFMDSLHRDRWRLQGSTPEDQPFRPRLASLPVAIHPPSVFDADVDELDGRKSTERGERMRLIDRLQPRRASFSSMTELHKLQRFYKTYDSYRTDLRDSTKQTREMKKSQSTPFLFDEVPEQKKTHRPFGFNIRNVFSTLSIHKLLDQRQTERTSLLSESFEDDIDTKF